MYLVNMRWLCNLSPMYHPLNVVLGRNKILQASSDKVWVYYPKMFYIICYKLRKSIVAEIAFASLL